MELIEELEGSPRGPYGGAVGYLSCTGDMDSCIAIRTFVQVGGEIQVQAGAGVVYDSHPEAEYDETRNKAEALFRALKKAAGGREDR
jgi:anthranilate synthase component 1